MHKISCHVVIPGRANWHNCSTGCSSNSSTRRCNANGRAFYPGFFFGYLHVDVLLNLHKPYQTPFGEFGNTNSWFKQGKAPTEHTQPTTFLQYNLSHNSHTDQKFKKSNILKLYNIFKYQSLMLFIIVVRKYRKT